MLLWTVVVLFMVIGLATKAAADEDSAAELRRRAEKSYAQIAPCLQSAWIYQAMYQNAAKNHTFSFPDDAQAHFEQVKKALARFATTAHMHTYRHYSGPWIENVFISHFQRATLKDLHGIIPLFVPWVDNQRTGDQLWQEIFKALKSVLRPDVIYLAVSQGDIGLAKIGEYFPNVLVLSGGGFGHVPVPLIKGLLPYNAVTQWPPHWDQEIGFFGNLHQATRPIMFDAIRAAADKAHMTHKIAFGPTWMDMMAKSKFNLAPRGFGRSSFRFAEAIHIGRVPVFLYDDVPWIPYLGSSIDIGTYGFMAGLNATDPNLHVNRLVSRLKAVGDEEYRAKHDQVQKVREHFTYAGVMAQIERFLTSPFRESDGGGFLTCTPAHPRQEHDTLRRRR